MLLSIFEVYSTALAAAALDSEIKKVMSFYSKQESAVRHAVRNLEDTCHSLQARMSDKHTSDQSKLELSQQHLQNLQETGKLVSNLLQVCVHVLSYSQAAQAPLYMLSSVPTEVAVCST